MIDWPKIRLLEARLRWHRATKYAYRRRELERYIVEGNREHFWLDKHKKEGKKGAAATKLNERQIVATRAEIHKWQALIGEEAREMHRLEAAIAKLKPAPGHYVNPFSRIKNLVPLGLDKGVDYGGSGEIVAMGNGFVNYASQNTTWPGGAFVGITLTDGVYRGKHIYHAEHLTILVREGQHVKANQPVAILHNEYPFSESGWGTGSGENTLAAALGQPRDGAAAGISFNRLLIKLGCRSGGSAAQVGPGMPPGFP